MSSERENFIGRTWKMNYTNNTFFQIEYSDALVWAFLLDTIYR